MPNSGARSCPVCGYPNLEEPPYDRYGSSSFGICPSCGTEFGYDDAHATMAPADVHADLRQKWADRGYAWADIVDDPPTGWDPVQQLINAGLNVPMRRSPTGPALFCADVQANHVVTRPQVRSLQILPSNERFVLRRLGAAQAIVFDTLHASIDNAKTRALNDYGVAQDGWRTPNS